MSSCGWTVGDHTQDGSQRLGNGTPASISDRTLIFLKMRLGNLHFNKFLGDSRSSKCCTTCCGVGKEKAWEDRDAKLKRVIGDTDCRSAEARRQSLRCLPEALQAEGT